MAGDGEADDEPRDPLHDQANRRRRGGVREPERSNRGARSGITAGCATMTASAIRNVRNSISRPGQGRRAGEEHARHALVAVRPVLHPPRACWMSWLNGWVAVLCRGARYRAGRRRPADPHGAELDHRPGARLPTVQSLVRRALATSNWPGVGGVVGSRWGLVRCLAPRPLEMPGHDSSRALPPGRQHSCGEMKSWVARARPLHRHERSPRGRA